MRTTSSAVAVIALSALVATNEQAVTVAAFAVPDGHVIEDFRASVSSRIEKLKARIESRGHGLFASSKLLQDIRDFVKGVIGDLRATIRDNTTEFLDENITDMETIILEQVENVVDKVGLPDFLEDRVVNEVKSVLDGFVDKYMDARGTTTTTTTPKDGGVTEAVKSDVMLKLNMVVEDHKAGLRSVITAGSPTEIVEALKAYLEDLLIDLRNVLAEDTKEFLNEDIVEMEEFIISSVDKVLDEYLTFLPEILRDQVVNHLETVLDVLVDKYFPEHEGDVGPPPSPHLAAALEAINNAIEAHEDQLASIKALAHKDMTPEEVEQFKQEMEAFIRDVLSDVKDALAEDGKEFLAEEIPKIEELLIDGISRVLDKYCKFLPEKVQDAVVIGLQAFMDALVQGYLPTPAPAPAARLLRGGA